MMGGQQAENTPLAPPWLAPAVVGGWAAMGGGGVADMRGQQAEHTPLAPLGWPRRWRAKDKDQRSGARGRAHRTGYERGDPSVAVCDAI